MEEDATNRLTGPIHGAAVQAHTIHGGVHVHLPATEEDAPPLDCAPPLTWDDVGVLPAEVRALSQAQTEAARELPYRLLPGARRPSLDTVYVRQDLGSGLEEGADVTPHLRKLMVDVNVRRGWREVSAVTLARLCPELREQAVAELRAQSNDEFLEFTSRVAAMVELGQLDAATRTTTIAYCRAVVNDEHRSVSDRCQAAHHLAELDESTREWAMTALRRFATSPQFTVEERWEGVNQLGELTSRDSPETTMLSVAVAQDPAATASLRTQVHRRLPGRPQLEMKRSLLTDRTARSTR